MLEHEGFRVVLDLGYATLPRLLAVVRSPVADGVDAVIVTHRHADHAADLHGLFRARWFGRRGAGPLPLYAPAAVPAQLAALEEDDADAALRQVFDWHPLPAPDYEVGPFRLQSWALPHFVPNAGVRLSTGDLTVAYTGDTGPDPALVDLGRGADVYIMESTDRDQRGPTAAAPAGRRRHLRAREAGPGRCLGPGPGPLLSHFWPGNDREASRAAAPMPFPARSSSRRRTW